MKMTNHKELNMAEFCDIYDINRNKTGRLHERGKPDMLDGDYLLIVMVWINSVA